MSGTAVVEAPAKPFNVDAGRQRKGEKNGLAPAERIESIPRTAEIEESPVERVCGMGPDRRLAAYEEGMLNLRELTIWVARFPEEVPMVNGEFPWIALTLADLE